MPFKSKAQRAWMYANKPEMAKRWQKETPKGSLRRKVKQAAPLSDKSLRSTGQGSGQMMLANADRVRTPGAPPSSRMGTAMPRSNDIQQIKVSKMKKTASEIADTVLYKCAKGKLYSEDDERLRNILIGGATGLNPLIGAIAASASKAPGDPTQQFWGTLGGGMGGAVLGSTAGTLLSRVARMPLNVPIWAAHLGAGAGGYGAQRLMANKRG